MDAATTRKPSLIILSVLTGSLALLLIATSWHGVDGFAAVLEMLATVLGGWAICRIAVKANKWTKTRDLFAPALAFPAAYILWFTVGSINFIDLPETISFGAFAPIPGRMWLYYAAGLGGYLIGLALVRTKPNTSRNDVRVTTSFDKRKFWYCAALLTLGMLGSYTLLAYMYGIPALTSNAEELRLKWVGQTHTIFICTSFVLVIILVAFMCVSVISRREKQASIALLFLAGAFLASTAGRTSLVIPLVTSLIIIHYTKTRFQLGRLFIMALVALIGLSAVGYARDYAWNQDDPAAFLSAAGVPPLIAAPLYSLLYARYSAATFRDITELIPDRVPFQHGSLTFVPIVHFFFRSSQESSDLFFKHILGNDFAGAGQPATLLGPFYADFGILGITIGLMLFGILMATVYRRLLQRNRILDVILYAWVLQVGLFGLFATLFQGMATLWVPMLCVVIGKFVSKPV